MDLRECCGSDRFYFISWSNQLAGMAGPDDIFNLLVHVGPPHLLSESGCCAHHSLMALMEKLYRTLPEALWHYTLPRFSSCSFWARPTTLTSPCKLLVMGQSFRICHLNLWNFSVARLNPTNKAKKVNFRPYHATTSNSWHYSSARSVRCWSIVFLDVV